MAIPVRTALVDLTLPLAVVAVVGMMIFPLPNPVLDLLLTCNIAFALSLLVSSVYLLEPAKFTSLPTVLLLSTLFRLGLNISTTRQVLTLGDAPELVKAFGSFVVGGNLVVGVVVFAIVTLVQFMVIAKGAERVAEVAARFALDAMPGKQMSIDADVRAGILTVAEAKDRRAALQSESKLYGALDGAMKFVKGDAIAGLIITVVNICGGLLIGVTQHGMSISVAARTFTLFTIGDGLVSQIPALLVAVAAGVVVTRVENQERTFVGRELMAQLGREPQALATTGMVLFILALVPGMPVLPFLLGSLLLLVAAFRREQCRQSEAREESAIRFTPKVFSPLLVRGSIDAVRKLHHEGAIVQDLQRLRNGIFERRGVIVPEIQFDIDSTAENEILAVLFHGVPMMSVVELAEHNTLSRALIGALEQILAEHLDELVDDTTTRMLLEVHQSTAEDLINSVVPQLMSVTGLSTLLKQLIREGVSIKEFRLILQAIAEHHLKSTGGELYGHSADRRQRVALRDLKGLGESPPPTQLVELLAEIRIKLARTISQGLADREWQICGWTLDPKIDRYLAQVSYAGTPLDPNFVEQLIHATSTRDGQSRIEGVPFVLITSRYSRTLVAEIVGQALKHARVLAFDELSDEVKLRVLGVVSLSLEEPGEDYEMAEAA